jgi:creatinine deaminase
LNLATIIHRIRTVKRTKEEYRHMEDFLKEALEEARAALQEGGIPTGCVLVVGGKIAGRGRNRILQNNDPTAHAEIECLRNAGRLGIYRNAVLVSTAMPCYLCSGAAVQLGIEKIIVGDARNYCGDREFLKDHWVSVDDVDDRECIELLENFKSKNAELWNEYLGK